MHHHCKYSTKVQTQKRYPCPPVILQILIIYYRCAGSPPATSSTSRWRSYRTPPWRPPPPPLPSLPSTRTASETRRSWRTSFSATAGGILHVSRGAFGVGRGAPFSWSEEDARSALLPNSAESSGSHGKGGRGRRAREARAALPSCTFAFFC